MKKFLLSFALFLSISALSFGQTKAIKVGPLGFLLGYYNASYEGATGNHSSFVLGGNYYDFEHEKEEINGYGAYLGFRYYFKEALRGLYVFPSVGYDFLSSKEEGGVEGNFNYLSLSGMVGLQWLIGGSFALDFGAGYGYDFEVKKDKALAADYNKPELRLLFNIGYAF